LRASFSQLLAFELGEESVFLLLFLFFPDFTTGWPRASGVGERGGGEGDGAAGGIATFPLSFSIRLPLNGKLRALRCGTKETNAHKEKRMQGRRNGD